MADFVQTMRDWKRMCNAMGQEDTYTACDKCDLRDFDCPAIYEDECNNADWNHVESVVTSWAAEHPEPVYETWFEYLLRIGVIPKNAPAGGEYQWIVENIKHKHISNDIAESLKLHPKEVQA